MPGHVSNYAINTVPSPGGGGTGTEAADKTVLYWDATNNLIKGSADFVFNDTLKQLTLGAGSQLLLPDGSAAVPSLSFGAETALGMYRIAASWLGIAYNSVPRTGYYAGAASWYHGSTVQLKWVNSANISAGTVDLALARDGAGILAQKNGANAQEFRIYGGTSSFIRCVGNTTNYLVSNDATPMNIGTDGAANLRFWTNAATRWSVDTAGMLAGLGTTDTIQLKVKGYSSQTANLQEWQKSDGTVYSRVKSDGRWRHDGATTWNDLRIEPVARSTGANAPSFEKYFDDAGGTSRGVYLYSFDDAPGGSEKEIFFTMQMPHDWKEGTAIRLHCHWVGSVNDTTSAPRWGLEYVWKDIGQTFGDTVIVYSTGVNIDGSGSSDPNITAGKHYISEFTVITPGTDANNISSIIIGRLFRNSANAGDTYDAATNKCGLLYIDAHYEVDSFGSDSEFVKG